MIRELTVAGYLLCAVVAVCLIVASRLPRSPLATPTELLGAVLARRAPRVTLLVFWWWLGWHFLVARTVDPPLAGLGG